MNEQDVYKVEYNDYGIFFVAAKSYSEAEKIVFSKYPDYRIKQITKLHGDLIINSKSE